MQLTRPTEVQNWCRARGFNPSRTLGQNFLVDRNILEAIIGAAALERGAKVLEVGAGLGVVTTALLEAGAQVTAVEKDHRLAAWLRESLGEHPNLRLIESDMLELDLAKLLINYEADKDAEGSERSHETAPFFDICVSNLPYSAGTRILLDLCGHRFGPALLLVMLQQEVAERLAAGANEAERGMAGVWVQQTHRVEIVRSVKATCFWPRPEIDSSLVRLVRHNELPLMTPERRIFERLTRHAFSHRRKQMQRIARMPPPWPPPKSEPPWKEFFEAIAIAPAARPAELTTTQWVALARAVTHHLEGQESDDAGKVLR